MIMLRMMVTLMEGKRSCHRVGQFNGGRIVVMLQN